MKQSTALPLGQHVPAKFAPHLGKGRRTRAENLDPFPVALLEQSLPDLSHLLSRTLRSLLTVSGQSEIDEPGEGGVFQLSSEQNLLTVEA
jgi:hypothetical protein